MLESFIPLCWLNYEYQTRQQEILLYYIILFMKALFYHSFFFQLIGLFLINAAALSRVTPCKYVFISRDEYRADSSMLFPRVLKMTLT